MVILGFAGFGWVLGGLGGLDLGGLCVCGVKMGLCVGVLGGNLGRVGLWWEIRPRKLSNL